MRNESFRPFDVLRAAAAGLVLTIVVGACSSSANAGWTFAPEPSVTPAPVASGSAAPSASAAASAAASGAAPSGSAAASGAPASAGASPVASAGATPAPSGSGSTTGGTPSETTVRVKAANIAFDTPVIQAPAGQAFVIEFDNEDASTPHNIDIKDPSGASVFKGDLVTGIATATYQVPALAAGTAYTFSCDVHPNMTGTVTVQ